MDSGLENRAKREIKGNQVEEREEAVMGGAAGQRLMNKEINTKGIAGETEGRGRTSTRAGAGRSGLLEKL